MTVAPALCNLSHFDAVLPSSPVDASFVGSNVSTFKHTAFMPSANATRFLDNQTTR
jgi:hypothetical protein